MQISNYKIFIIFPYFMTKNIQFVLTLLLHKIWSINISQIGKPTYKYISIGKLDYKKMALKINLRLHKIAKMRILLINPQAENKINKNKMK